MSRTNFTPENEELTRDHIQAFLDEGRGAKDNKGKRPPSKKTPDNLKAELKSKGHKDDEISKVMGDWDSYL